jgi:quinol-cytochrome oxidoreductase complex cytochrome b subunit
MKTSQIAAKFVVRLFFILLLIALVPFFQGNSDKLQHLYLNPKNTWTLAYPILLIIGFITLLVLCSIKKYSQQDLNWFLVLNTVILLIYGATLYFRIYQIIK